MWFKGCFLRLLNAAPEVGVDTIAKMARHIAACWRVFEERDQQQIVEIDIEIDGVLQRWPGDKDLFLAYRDLGRIPDSVVSALMALEKYFYGAVDRGEDVEPLLTAVLRNGSVPLAGVLTAVGHYHPHLFDGPLRPLLGVAEFMVWDWQNAQTRDDRGAAGIAWSMRGPEAASIIRDWTEMPHRSMALMNVAVDQFLATGDSDGFFAHAVARWREKFQSEPWPAVFELDRLIAFFDQANYQEVEQEGSRGKRFVAPGWLLNNLARVV
jgi:hypothetical protein